MDVYKASAFEDRVNYAAACIARANGSVPQGRHFDTCFEMGDGDYVAAALVRRTLAHPSSKLARHITAVLPVALKAYEQTKHLTRRELAQTAIRETVESCRKGGYRNL
jgi:hypothetical protein